MKISRRDFIKSTLSTICGITVLRGIEFSEPTISTSGNSTSPSSSALIYEKDLPLLRDSGQTMWIPFPGYQCRCAMIPEFTSFDEDGFAITWYSEDQ